MELVFLRLGDVLEIHADQIAHYGGTQGVRDPELLEAAVAMPKAGMRDRYLHADLFEMAAAYLYHIARNHPFVDGNKRTGLAAAVVFLEMNDTQFEASQDEVTALVEGVAAGAVPKARAADFLRRHSHPTTP